MNSKQKNGLISKLIKYKKIIVLKNGEKPIPKEQGRQFVNGFKNFLNGKKKQTEIGQKPISKQSVLIVADRIIAAEQEKSKMDFKYTPNNKSSIYMALAAISAIKQ